MPCLSIIISSLWIFVTCVHSTNTFNVALGKNVSQSSLYLLPDGSFATGDKSVDGNTDLPIEQCASTAHYDLDPWWKVDLQGIYTVISLKITNRNSHGFRLHNFTVTVSGEDNSPGAVCVQYPGEVPSGATITVSCDQITWGRYVKITKQAIDFADILTLCEVQVIAINRTYMLFERKAGKPATSDVSSTMTTDFPTCAQTCKNSLDCVGLNYNKELGECQLAHSTDSEESSVNSGWDFFVLML